jgi:hypothetical protein
MKKATLGSGGFSGTQDPENQKAARVWGGFRGSCVCDACELGSAPVGVAQGKLHLRRKTGFAGPLIEAMGVPAPAFDQFANVRWIGHLPVLFELPDAISTVQ